MIAIINDLRKDLRERTVIGKCVGAQTLSDKTSDFVSL